MNQTLKVSTQKRSSVKSVELLPCLPWPVPASGFSCEVAVVERTRPARESLYFVLVEPVPFRPGLVEVSGYVLTRWADGERITAKWVAGGSVYFAGSDQPSAELADDFRWLVAHMRGMAARVAKCEERARRKGTFR